ncbi:MAG: hypothetical protein RL291_1600 [Pseudomonadota bacterium]
MWILFTVIAAGAQTLRNALQKELQTTLGTAGATHVRFLYGLPFGLLFLVLVAFAHGRLPPVPNGRALLLMVIGAVAQIIATALLLSAMKEQSFVITTAYAKTEPVQVALFGLVLLGDKLTVPMALAILVATAGVVIMGWPKAQAADGAKATAGGGGLGPVALGLGAAAMFGLSAVGFRGAILALDDPSFVLRASTVLGLSLTTQTIILSTYLAMTAPETLGALGRAWKPSLPAGFAGAFASQMWFLAFALETAAKVRTLALIEIFFAYAISRRLFSQDLSRREILGLVLVVLGVAWLLNIST